MKGYSTAFVCIIWLIIGVLILVRKERDKDDFKITEFEFWLCYLHLMALLFDILTKG